MRTFVGILIVAFGLAQSAFAERPLPSGEFFGGGAYRFQATGVKGPYSIHYSITPNADSAEAADWTIDSALSSSGPFLLKILADENESLSIQNKDGTLAGEGYCLRDACHLHFKVDTITFDSKPIQADFDMTLFKSSKNLRTLGVIILGSRIIYFNDHLNLIPPKRARGRDNERNTF